MIQFRMLNTKKGPAVQSPRSQADKLEYNYTMKLALERTENLDIFQDTVVDLIVEQNKYWGHDRTGEQVHCEGCRTHNRHIYGRENFYREFTAVNGRIAEPAACGLSKNLVRLDSLSEGLKQGRRQGLQNQVLTSIRWRCRSAMKNWYPFPILTR